MWRRGCIQTAAPLKRRQLFRLSLTGLSPEGLGPASARVIPACTKDRDLHLQVLLVPMLDRKSTRLNSSHSQISYAVFCLKKKRSCHREGEHSTRLNPRERLLGRRRN